ncbi:tail fiber assembly protein [Salmonella enterica subsp. enterica]|nr:tail fiber assembly protein [Salmonella enterica subsp. enterica serovar Langford]
MNSLYGNFFQDIISGADDEKAQLDEWKKYCA